MKTDDTLPFVGVIPKEYALALIPLALYLVYKVSLCRTCLILVLANMRSPS